MNFKKKERKESRSEDKPHSWNEHTDNNRMSTVQKTLRACNPLGTFEATRSVSKKTGVDRLLDVIKFVKSHVEKLLEVMVKICNRYQEN